MKRLTACILVIALCLSASALAERTVYADQGGVRVYAEDGRVGLMDSEGGVLCPAEYDQIDPFMGSDYALALKDGKAGVVRRDGAEVIACEWDDYFSRMLTGTRYARMCADMNDQRLIDLDTGETVMAGEYIFGVEGDCIYALSYGYYDYWELQPPFATRVFDFDMNPLIDLDGELEARTAMGWITADGAYWGDGRTYTLRDAAGEPLVRDLWEYDIGPDGAVYYSRNVTNLIGAALEALGYYQNNVKWILHNLFGIELETAKAITRLMMDDWRICGIWRPDGSLTELKADALRAPMSPNGLCPVRVGEVWGYLDEAGEIALPPAYEEAGPFIDGAAVVIEDGACRLIDARGATLSPAWDSPRHLLYHWGKGPECCRMNVVAARMDGGVRLIDRQGRFVTDEVFDGEDFEPVGGSIMGPWNIYNEQTYLLRDAGGRVCAFDGEGRELCRFDAESWEAGIIVDDGAALWAEAGGKWGIVNLTGADAGAWRAEPVYDSIYREGPGLCSAWLPDYTNVMLDDWGNVLGPLYVEDEMVAIMKAADAATTTTPEGEEVYQADGSAVTESEISAFTDEPEA